MSAARRRAALGALCVAVACGTAEQQLETDRRFVSITYQDTTIESFSRTNRAITGVLISGEGDSVRFRIRTMPKGLVAGVDVTLHPASSRGERPVTRQVAMPKGTLPLMQTSVAFLEQLLRRARAVGGDSVSVPVMLVGAQASLDVFTVIANGSDSVLIVDHEGNPTNALHLAVDSAGRILGGVVPTSGTRISAVRPP